MIGTPSPDLVFEDHDILVLFGKETNLIDFAQLSRAGSGNISMDRGPQSPEPAFLLKLPAKEMENKILPDYLPSFPNGKFLKNHVSLRIVSTWNQHILPPSVKDYGQRWRQV